MRNGDFVKDIITDQRKVEFGNLDRLPAYNNSKSPFLHDHAIFMSILQTTHRVSFEDSISKKQNKTRH